MPAMAPLLSSSHAEPLNAARRRLLRLGAGSLGALALAACRHEAGSLAAGRFPDFTLPDVAGITHAAAEFRGRPLLVNFWATWCPPCRAEMGDLDVLQRQTASRGLKLIAISVDSDANLVREFLRGKPASFLVLVDAGQQWSRTALRMPGLPTTYLVGADGDIRTAWVGPRAWADSAVQADVLARMA